MKTATEIMPSEVPQRPRSGLIVKDPNLGEFRVNNSRVHHHTEFVYNFKKHRVASVFNVIGDMVICNVGHTWDLDECVSVSPSRDKFDI